MLLNNNDKTKLLQLAKHSIEHGLQTGKPLAVNLVDLSPALKESRASFVTLHINQQLRGCIGSLEARQALAKDVADNAFNAAFKDSRFPPLTADELGKLQIHLSILSPAEPFPVVNEQDLLARLQPGIDGLILQEGQRRATFLPSVWETLPKPEDFLRHLKQKAGLPSDYWSDSIKFYRYSAEAVG